MSKITFRVVLAVGDNPDELIGKYDLDTKVEPYVKLKRSDAAKSQRSHLRLIEEILKSDKIALADKQREIYKNMYLDIQEMDEAEYFDNITHGCTYDDETGDAISTVNPNAYYQHACNPQKRLEASDEEHDFCNPFFLLPNNSLGEKRGDIISYKARKGDIDWELMHMHNTEIYYRAWEMCVEGDEPRNEQEKTIKSHMENRTDYFNNFDTADDYVAHSCSFWCYGYVDENGYKELDHTVSDKDWVRNFYDNFIKPLPNDADLSLYVVRAID